MSKSTDRILFAADERIPLGLALLLALTHVSLIFDGVIFIPNLIGKLCPVPPEQVRFATFAVVVVSGLVTMIQALRPKGLGTGYVMFCGSYSAYLTCSVAAVDHGGFALLGLLVLASAPVMFLYSYLLRHLRHIITPAVGGMIIVLLMLSLLPIGLDLWQGGDAGNPGYGDAANLVIGAGTALTVALVMLFGNRVLRLVSPILAFGVGYALAVFTGRADFANTAAADWFGLPPMVWPGLAPHLDGTALSLMVTFALVTLVSAIESTGNLMLVQEKSERELTRIDYRRVQSGLYADGLGKVLAGLLGTAAPSTYSDNLPILDMTGVAARRVGVLGGALLVLLAFFPKAGGLILDMPPPVIGGFLVAFSGILFKAGLEMIFMRPMGTQHQLILGLSLCAGLMAEATSFFPSLASNMLKPLLSNGIAVGGLTACALNTVVYLWPRPRLRATLPARAASVAELEGLVTGGRAKLRLTNDELARLQLCCEEVLLHLADQAGEQEKTVSFVMERTEDGLFVEAVSGFEADDVNNFRLPVNVFSASRAELGGLGLKLLNSVARGVTHVSISGYDYISFQI